MLFHNQLLSLFLAIPAGASTLLQAQVSLLIIIQYNSTILMAEEDRASSFVISLVNSQLSPHD